jgi:hypothetical protein
MAESMYRRNRISAQNTRNFNDLGAIDWINSTNFTKTQIKKKIDTGWNSYVKED